MMPYRLPSLAATCRAISSCKAMRLSALSSRQSCSPTIRSKLLGTVSRLERTPEKLENLMRERANGLLFRARTPALNPCWMPCCHPSAALAARIKKKPGLVNRAFSAPALYRAKKVFLGNAADLGHEGVINAHITVAI